MGDHRPSGDRGSATPPRRPRPPPRLEDIRRLGRQWLWFLPVLGLGLVRFGSGLSRGKPIAYLLVLLAATVLAMVITAKWPLRARTRQGDRLLRKLDKEFLTGESRFTQATTPSAGLPERDGAGRLLAVRGAGGLWKTDRPLALAVGAGSLAAATADTDSRRSFWASWGGGGGSEARDRHASSGGYGGYAGYGGGCGSGGGGCGGGGGGCGG